MTMAQEERTQQGPIRPTYGYYRQTDGWITASPMTDLDELKYRRGGWEPLKQYGYFEMATDWAANHPLETLFMKGGAHELSVDQILKQGLYLDPPLVPTCRQSLSQEHKRHTYACMANAKPVQFPQLAGRTDLGPFPCTFGCGRDLPTIEARDQHASVMHAPEKSDERTGESLAAALVKGLSGQNPVAPAAAPAVDVNKELLDVIAQMRTQILVLRDEIGELQAAQQPPAPPTAAARPKTPGR